MSNQFDSRFVAANSLSHHYLTTGEGPADAVSKGVIGFLKGL